MTNSETPTNEAHDDHQGTQHVEQREQTEEAKLRHLYEQQLTRMGAGFG